MEVKHNNWLSSSLHEKNWKVKYKLFLFLCAASKMLATSTNGVATAAASKSLLLLLSSSLVLEENADMHKSKTSCLLKKGRVLWIKANCGERGEDRAWEGICLHLCLPFHKVGGRRRKEKMGNLCSKRKRSDSGSVKSEGWVGCLNS